MSIFSLKTFEQAYETAVEYAGHAQRLYTQAENQLVVFAKDVLPAETHRVAEKVARAVPETLFTVSMITGQLKLAASAFGIGRLIWAAAPVVESVFNGDFDGEPMQQALNRSIERIQAVYEKFRPAIFVACAVSAVAATALGVLSLSPTLTATGAFMGVLSYMAYEGMQEKPAAQPVPVVEID